MATTVPSTDKDSITVTPGAVDRPIMQREGIGRLRFHPDRHIRRYLRKLLTTDGHRVGAPEEVGRGLRSCLQPGSRSPRSRRVRRGPAGDHGAIDGIDGIDQHCLGGLRRGIQPED